MRHGADSLRRPRRGLTGSAAAPRGRPSRFPLDCRDRTVGALVGLDQTPSSATPSIRGRRSALLLRPFSSRRRSRSTTRLRCRGRGAVGHRRPDPALQLALPEPGAAPGNQARRRAAAGRCRCCSSTWTASSGQRHPRPPRWQPGACRGAAVIRALRARDRRRGAVRRRRVRADPARHRQRGRRCGRRAYPRADQRAQFPARDGLSVHLTASIGVATLPDVAGSAEELMQAADTAMYRVKDAGKNGIHIAWQERTDGSRAEEMRTLSFGRCFRCSRATWRSTSARPTPASTRAARASSSTSRRSSPSTRSTAASRRSARTPRRCSAARPATSWRSSR